MLKLLRWHTENGPLLAVICFEQKVNPVALILAQVLVHIGRHSAARLAITLQVQWLGIAAELDIDLGVRVVVVHVHLTVICACRKDPLQLGVGTLFLTGCRS